MNKKGFTLVELLATIVLLSIVMGIAVLGVSSAINKSKEKSEKIFVSEIDNVIQSYISYNRLHWSVVDVVVDEYEKCSRVAADDSCVDADGNPEAGTKVKVYNVTPFSISSLADKKYIEDGKLVNPKNKLNCLKNLSVVPDVLLYKDEDSVYYYYVDLRGSKTSCDISEEEGLITNIPKKLCNSLSNFSWNDGKEECVKNET